MSQRNSVAIFAFAMCCGAVFGLPCHVQAQGVTDYKPGQGGGPVGGAAGPQGASGAPQSLEKCDKPIASITVSEPQDYATKALLQYGLPSPTGLIRLMIQQSNCFRVVERGVAMQNLMQERALAQSGELRAGSQMGQGQMVTADYVLTPDVVFTQSDAGAIGGALSALGGRKGSAGAVAGAIAGGLKFKQAQTSMLVADTRSGLQVAAASGSVEKADFGIGGAVGGGWSSGAAALGLGAYENTAEGKIVAASYLDNYNKIVRAVRGHPELDRPLAAAQAAVPPPPPPPAAPPVAVPPGMQRGDVLVPKISGVKLHSQASETSRALATLTKSDELVYLGNEENGFLSVRGAAGSGWVDKLMMRKQ